MSKLSQRWVNTDASDQLGVATQFWSELHGVLWCVSTAGLIFRDRLQCKCRKATLGLIPMKSYYEYCIKNYLIGTDIGVKLGTVPICIRIGIGISIDSVKTVLHIIILAI